MQNVVSLLIRLRDVLVPLLGDARYALAVCVTMALIALCAVGRLVVAVVQDVWMGVRRMWE